MNNNEGLENIKKQMSDLFSLKKEIGRKEFILYSITPILLFLLFIFFLFKDSYLLFSNVDSAKIILIGVVISVIIASAVCLTIFSLQRLNSLKLNRNISYVFIVTALIILIQTIAPAIESKARRNDWKAVETFFEILSHGDLYDFLEISTFILSLICIILIILLSLLKGIDK